MTSPVLLAVEDEGDLLDEIISVRCVIHARARATTSASTWVNQVRYQYGFGIKMRSTWVSPSRIVFASSLSSIIPHTPFPSPLPLPLGPFGVCETLSASSVLRTHELRISLHILHITFVRGHSKTRKTVKDVKLTSQISHLLVGC